MEDKDILDYKVGETTIHDMSAIGFLQWVAGRVNGITSFSAAAIELRGLVSMPPISRTMADMEKIRIFRRLQDAGVTL